MKTMTTPATTFVVSTQNNAPRSLPRDPEQAAEALFEAQEEGEAGREDGMFACCLSAHDDCLMPDARSIKRIDHDLHEWEQMRAPRSPVQIEQEWDRFSEWRWSLRAECPRCDQVTELTFRPGDRAEWQVVDDE